MRSSSLLQSIYLCTQSTTVYLPVCLPCSSCIQPGCTGRRLPCGRPVYYSPSTCAPNLLQCTYLCVCLVHLVFSQGGLVGVCHVLLHLRQVSLGIGQTVEGGLRVASIHRLVDGRHCIQYSQCCRDLVKVQFFLSDRERKHI